MSQSEKEAASARLARAPRAAGRPHWLAAAAAPPAAGGRAGPAHPSRGWEGLLSGPVAAAWRSREALVVAALAGRPRWARAEGVRTRHGRHTGPLLAVVAGQALQRTRRRGPNPTRNQRWARRPCSGGPSQSLLHTPWVVRRTEPADPRPSSARARFARAQVHAACRVTAPLTWSAPALRSWPRRAQAAAGAPGARRGRRAAAAAGVVVGAGPGATRLCGAPGSGRSTRAQLPVEVKARWTGTQLRRAEGAWAWAMRAGSRAPGRQLPSHPQSPGRRFPLRRACAPGGARSWAAGLGSPPGRVHAPLETNRAPRPEATAPPAAAT
mmetsp:Transcript_11271/g.30455  ORF Transcript_11271/g.30455 Transcript_11271/m.30455 type:complete len:325 (+) Transcript_11271:524-1498(+)